MNVRPLLLPAAVIAGAIAIAIGMMTWQPEIKTHIDEKKLPTVQVQIAAPVDVTLSVTAQGTVTPLQQVTLTSEVAGRVIWVAPTFRIGELVRKNDSLLKLDTTNFMLAVATAQSMLRDAELALAQEQARSEQASDDWQSSDAGDATPLGLRKPQLDAATAKVDAARAQLAKAQQDFERCDIRAPFDAIIDKKSAELGQYISIGLQLAELLGTVRAEVRLPIAFERSLYLAPADGKTTVVISDDTRADVTWNATLQRIDQQINADTRVLYATIGIEQPYAQKPPLRLGQFVSVTLPGRTLTNAQRLPRSAVSNVQADGRGDIFIVDEKNTLRRTTVDVLASEPGASIVSGIDAGTRIVVTRLDVMSDGLQVTPAAIATSGSTTAGSSTIAGGQ